MDSALLLLFLWALTGTASPQASGSCVERLQGGERKTRACPRTCKSDAECGSKRQCLCDGECGLSCVAPGRTCPWPLPASENLMFRLVSATPSFSALLEVRCKPGFTLPDGPDVTVRRCQGDRQWSGDEPICAGGFISPGHTPAPTCPLPEEVINTFSVHGGASVGTSIRYSSLFYHKMNLLTTIKPLCLVELFCQPPKEVQQGYVVAVQKTEYEVGFDIHYLCKKNYRLDGPQKITCLSNGSWSASPPHCRARCVIPAERSRVVIGGVKRWPFDVTDAMVPHGENVTFYCKHPKKQCSFTAAQACFDGKLQTPECYLEPTWLQYKLFPHRLVSEIETCAPGDVE
uniref:Beta-2-glycoprotein 1 n=1 Tax=Poecilia reticulata TaxID=8081 RepID=A0A3P9NRK6_POERE